MTGHVARAEVQVTAPVSRVWEALTNPALIAQYMHGSRVDTDWQVGSPITWSGEYDGRSYQDRGEVVTFEPDARLVVTHFSPLTGQTDEPGNYHTLDYRLAEEDAGSTHLSLEQDGCDSAEQANTFSANWQSMLDALKHTVESGPK
jgi:uncharacterized protein YndB with AHSA1/START domain